MKPAPYEKLKELAQVGANIAMMTASPVLRPLGANLALLLSEHAEEVFPKEFEALRARAREQARADMAVKGPPLWAELHKRALGPVPDTSNEMEWLRAWGKRIPCGDCKKSLREFARKNPVNFSNYFVWTVDLHNFVNRKLSKAEVTAEDAREKWGK